MSKILTHIIVTAFALLVAAYVVPGIHVSNLTAALLAALALGFLNTLVRPVLFVVTLPLTFITLGLFVLVINTALFMLAAELIPGFAVSSFLAAALGSIIVSVVSMLTYKFLPGK